MQRNKLKYLIAGLLGAGGLLLASVGASAHLGTVRTDFDKLPTPGAAVSAAEEVEASPSPEPSETPEATPSPEPSETPEAAPAPEPTETPEATAVAEPAGANVEQEGDHSGGAGDTTDKADKADKGDKGD